MRMLLRVSAMVPALALAAPVSVLAQGVTFNRDFIHYEAPTIGAPRSIVSADFNRDGFPDVALGGTTRASIGVMFHHGFEFGDEGQRFSPVREIVVGGGPFELAAADVNRDGLPDIVVANADLNAVTVLLNDAAHEFRTVLQTPVPENPRGLAVADFNRDGIPDVVVTKYMGSTIEVLFGAGDGTFPTRRSHPAPANSQGVAAADFNHDGWMDAVVVSLTGAVSVYTMNAEGATREDIYYRGYGWNVVTTADFDRNGEVDVAYASTANSVVEVMYRPPGRVPDLERRTDAGRGIAARHRDGRHEPGRYARPRGRRPERSTATLLLRTGAAGHAYSRHDIDAGNGARDVTLVDFSGDGKSDMLTANEFGSSVTVLSNGIDMGPAPAFRFEALGVPDVFGEATFDALDFDRNGKLDLVVRNRVIFDGTTGSRVLSRSGFSTRGGAAGDFNNDGNPDVVYTENQSFRVYFGDGGRGFVDGPVTPTGALEGWQLSAADMNRDGRLDVVLLGTDFYSSGALQVYLGRGDGRFTFASSSSTTYRAREAALGDSGP